MRALIFVPTRVFAVYFAVQALDAAAGKRMYVVPPAIPCVRALSMAASNTVRSLSGIARPFSQFLVAPFSGRTCVWYRIQVEEDRLPQEHSTSDSSRRRIKKERSRLPFSLADDTGDVLINAEVASVGRMLDLRRLR